MCVCGWGKVGSSDELVQAVWVRKPQAGFWGTLSKWFKHRKIWYYPHFRDESARDETICVLSRSGAVAELGMEPQSPGLYLIL